jgi:hypothetical protein
MIPIEYFWMTLIFTFGIIGAVRGVAKELGTGAVLALTLFALWFGWEQAGDLVVQLVQRGPFEGFTAAQVEALYYTGAILLVAFIAYEGIVLRFPIALKGILNNIFGYLIGLLNGYLVVGTVWGVSAHAKYYWPHIKIVSGPFSDFHNTVIQYLPVTLMNDFSPFPMLILGMLLLLAIIFK